MSKIQEKSATFEFDFEVAQRQVVNETKQNEIIAK